MTFKLRTLVLCALLLPVAHAQPVAGQTAQIATPTPTTTAVSYTHLDVYKRQG